MPDELTANELLLRRLLWLNHGHSDITTIHNEKGEMFCDFCKLDFKRDSVTRIEGILTEHSLYEVAKRTNHQSGFPWTDPRTGKIYPPPPRKVG